MGLPDLPMLAARKSTRSWLGTLLIRLGEGTRLVRTLTLAWLVLPAKVVWVPMSPLFSAHWTCVVVIAICQLGWPRALRFSCAGF